MNAFLRWITPTVLLWALAALFLIPIAWFLLSSFKPGSELFAWPLKLFPTK